MLRRALFTLLFLGSIAGCDTLSPEPFVPVPVVSGVLVAGEPLTRIRFLVSKPIDQSGGESPTEEPTIRLNGEVEVRLLAQDGTVESVYAYEQRANGYYAPVEDAPPLVIGGRTYELKANFEGFEALRATTTVPTAFEVVSPPADTIRYQLDPQPSVDVTPSVSPGRQSVYIFTVTALELDPESLTPFARALYDNGDGDIDLEDLASGNSPLLNAENYESNPDGSITIRIPWLAVNFYGPHIFEATALDEAIVDLLESQAIQFNPTTLSPGEIPSVISNVENGEGVFGSTAGVRVEAFIARP